MKDRLPTYPGRIRLVPVPGQANVYDLERADEATQEGTPLNKANLLDDQTAARLGGDRNMSVNDALNVIIDDSMFQVGDIVRTAAALPSNWLRVNGAVINGATHPSLFRMFAYNGYYSVRTLSVSSSSALARLHFLKKINGYYIGMAYGSLFYRAEDESSWTVRNIASTLLGSYYRVEDCDILWDDVNDQYLIAANCERTQTDSTGRLRLFKLPTLDGTLTNILEKQTSGSGDTPVHLSKEGDFFFLHDFAYDNITTKNHTKKTYYATDPNDTWTQIDSIRGSSVTEDMLFVGGIRRINGRWFVGGAVRDGENGLQYPAVAISNVDDDFLTATWTVHSMGDGISTPEDFSRYLIVNNITYMPTSGAYLFAAGEQDDGDAVHFYSYDLENFSATTHAIGGSSEQPKCIDGVIYTTSGAYKDMAGNTGDPLGLSYTDGVNVPRNLTADGVYLTHSTTTVTENQCIKSLPDLGMENGLVYKIKATGSPASGGGSDPGYEPGWDDLEFTDPNNDGHIVITMGGD